MLAMFAIGNWFFIMISFFFIIPFITMGIIIFFISKPAKPVVDDLTHEKITKNKTRYKCPNCGGHIIQITIKRYNTTNSKYQCDYCLTSYTREELRS